MDDLDFETDALGLPRFLSAHDVPGAVSAIVAYEELMHDILQPLVTQSRCKHCGGKFKGYMFDPVAFEQADRSLTLEMLNWYCDEFHFIILSPNPVSPTFNRTPPALVIRSLVNQPPMPAP